MIGIIKKIISREIFLQFLLVFCLLLGNFLPILNNFLRAPSNRYYYGASEYPLDMIGNLAIVREGYLGHWQRVSKATSTVESKPTFIKFEYILIGQIARLLRLDPLIVFYATRIIISISLIWFLAFLISNLLIGKQARIISFGLSLFSGGILLPWDTKSIIYQLGIDAQVIQRYTSSTHHYMLSIFLALISLFYLAKSLDQGIFKPFLFSLAAGLISAFIFPASMLIVLASIPIYFLIRLVLKKKKIDTCNIKKQSFILFVYIVITSIPFSYLYYVSQFYDFNVLFHTESLVPFDMNIQNYIYAVGATFLLSIFSVPFVIKRKKTILFLLMPWIILHPLFVLFLSNFLHANPSRFFYTPYSFIFSIFATIFLINIAKRINVQLQNNIVIFLFILLIGISGYALKYSYNLGRLCFCTQPFGDIGYPKKEAMEGIFWLRDNTQEDDIVLSGYYTGNLIPAFAGNKVFTSWWFRLMESPDLNRNYMDFTGFFSGHMDMEEASKFLLKENIKYIYFGDEEQSFNSAGLNYNFLKEVKRSGKTIIYKVEI